MKDKDGVTQKDHVIGEINSWKGSCEQTDDILVIGLKI
jgi:hypothetical protein